MSWPGLVIAIIAGLISVDLLVHFCCAWIVIPRFERKPHFDIKPTSPQSDAERLVIPACPGVNLRGHLLWPDERPTRGLIVFCPEMEGSQWSAEAYCESLWREGFAILAFDFRNQGESDHMPGYEPLHWLTDYEVQDLLAVLGQIRKRDDLRDLPLGLFGISRGGSAALAVAAKCPDVKGVACEGAFGTDSLMLHFALRWASLYIPGWIMNRLPAWHVWITVVFARWLSQVRRNVRYTNLERLAARLHDRPVLFIAGSRDTYVPPESSNVLRRRLGQACRFVLVPDAKHNLARWIEPESYDRRLVEFFSELSDVSPSRRLPHPHWRTKNRVTEAPDI